MAISEAKRKANAKWDSENMATLACKVRKGQAAAFKTFCESQGKTSNTVIREYVLGCIDGLSGEESITCNNSQPVENGGALYNE